MLAPETTRRAHGRLLVVTSQMGEGQELRRSLERRGFHVRLALNGGEALERARNWHPSVVLIDLALEPESPSGEAARPAFELCERLKSSPDSASLPVLFLSRDEPVESWIDQGLEAGASDFVGWSAPLSVIQARIAQHVRLFETEARLRLKAIRDEVTGLYSGQFLVEHLRQWLSPMLRPDQESLCFMRIDLDRFPELADKLNSLQHESLLVLVSELLRENLGADLVARVAPDKFAVLLVGVSEDEGTRRAETTRTAVERETALEVPATVSIGLSCLTTRDLKAQGSVDAAINLLHKRASMGLQQAQSYGGNQVALFLESDAGDRRRGRRWEVDMRVELLGRFGVREASSATDLSNGGVALDGVADLKIGDHVELLLHLGDESLSATGVVAWSGAVLGSAMRCGIAFESLAGDGQEVLRRYLADRTRAMAEETNEEEIAR